jgi:hypothetical protein
VICPSIGNFIRSKKTYTFGGQKRKNKPSEPKNGIWAPKSVQSCDISNDPEFYLEQERIYFSGSKTKICPQSPKTEFGLQNKYGRVIDPSIGNFIWSKKKYTLEGQKGKNEPSEPKNGIWAPK